MTRPDARELQDLLADVGDHAGAFQWRRALRDLEGGLRVARIAREGWPLDPLPDAEWVELPLDASDDPVGVVDRLSSTHAAVAFTPYTSALGAEERLALEGLSALGLPARRCLVLVGRELLERVSDDPEVEARQVQARVQALAPAGWERVELEALGAWIDAARGDRRALSDQRRTDVARLLLADARARLGRQADDVRRELAEVDALSGAEDEALDRARAHGRRVAAHVLGALRRGTEQLLVDLRDLLLRLEADLPHQVEAVPDLRLARRALPHWLQHVIDHWLEERLGAWQGLLEAELAEVGLSADDAAHAALVAPSLAPPPMTDPSGWTRRVGTTVAMGGGAALAVAGLWVPALLAVGGGLAWSALGSAAAEAESRRQLVDTGIDAVRTMAIDAEGRLREQIEHVERALEGLGDEQAEAVARARSAARTELARRAAELDGRLRRHLADMERLDRAAEDLP